MQSINEITIVRNAKDSEEVTLAAKPPVHALKPSFTYKKNFQTDNIYITVYIYVYIYEGLLLAQVFTRSDR